MDNFNQEFYDNLTKEQKDYIQQSFNEFKKECLDYPYLPDILPAKRRIIVIGDLHGDYNLTLNSLKLAKVIDNNLKWIGDDTHVIQVGDQVDRCRPYNYKCDDPRATPDDEASDIKIMELFTNLHLQAIKEKGAVISLLGNHELLNVQGKMHHVSFKGLEQFKDYIDPKTGQQFSSGKEARKHLFKPGNKYGKFLGCTRLSTIIIGSFIFIHGGLINDFAQENNIKSPHDLLQLNRVVRQWLLGLIDVDYVHKIVGSLDTFKSVGEITKPNKKSLFWNRILGNIPPNVLNTDPVCVQYLNPILDLFKVKRMVIGHTPQFIKYAKGINKSCGENLWRVDTGSSGAFDKFDKYYSGQGDIFDLRKVQVLEILNDKTINVLK